MSSVKAIKEQLSLIKDDIAERNIGLKSLAKDIHNWQVRETKLYKSLKSNLPQRKKDDIESKIVFAGDKLKVMRVEYDRLALYIFKKKQLQSKLSHDLNDIIRRESSSQHYMDLMEKFPNANRFY